MSPEARPTRADFRATIALAVPIVTVNVGIMAMGVVDTMMVGHYSSSALASVALGHFYFFSIAIFGMGVLQVLDPLVAQAVGARDDSAIGGAVQRGFVLSVLLGAVLFPLFFACGPVLRLLRQPEEAIPGAVTFVVILAPSVFAMLAFVVMRQTLQAKRLLAPIVIAIVLGNVLNAGLNWVLIFGNLGSPALGIRGTAIATLISRFAVAGFVFAFSWRELGPYLRAPMTRFDGAALGAMLRLGIPIGLQQELEVTAFSFMMILMGWLGTVALVGHQIAINLASVTYMVPLGVASASAVLVGHAVGRGDATGARRAALAGLACGVGFMTLSALLFLTVPTALARLYTTDASVIALASALIPIAGFFQVFDGIQVVSLGVLRGVGDTRMPMVMSLVGYWIIGIPVGAWLAFALGFGAEGVWWGSVFGLASVAGLLLWRTRARLTRSISRLEQPQGARM